MRKIDVRVVWGERHDGDWRQMTLYVEINYHCPMDRFWDDDLTEMLASGDLKEALEKADYSAYGYENAKECDKYYESEIKTLLELTSEPERWTLQREFGSQEFRWNIRWSENQTDIEA